MVSHPCMTQTPRVPIKIDNLILNQVNECKFLGVTIHNLLKWKPHIESLKTKLSKVAGVVYRIRDCLDTESILQIYLSLSFAHLSYCCALWGERIQDI